MKRTVYILLLIFVPLILFTLQKRKGGGNSNTIELVKGCEGVSVTDESRKIGETWNSDEVWDQPVVEKFYHQLRAKKDHFTVLDIGAQTGCFTLLAKYFPNSSWYAFEPIKEAAIELEKNCQLNKVGNVRVFQVGLSNISGTHTLKLPIDSHWGLATFGSPERFKKFEERNVSVTTIDSFVEKHNLRKVDFIKIDTEGWELSVLRGGAKTLLRDHPVILMESNQQNMKQAGVKLDDIQDLLKSFNYQWEQVGQDDILCY